MHPMRHPELADRLAAAHALGTLRGGARRRFETLARRSPALRALALTWQERLAAMTELQPGAAPGPNVWKRIEIALRQEADAAALARQRQQGPARPGFWRGAALAGGFAALVGFTLAGYTAAQLRGATEIRYVAMLQDDRAAPQVLVTFDARHRTLTLKRLGALEVQPDRSLQLWALPTGGAPHSLGVLDAAPVVKLTAAEAAVQAAPAMAISLEPKGGAPAGSGPTGPVLFHGAVVPTT